VVGGRGRGLQAWRATNNRGPPTTERRLHEQTQSGVHSSQAKIEVTSGRYRAEWSDLIESELYNFSIFFIFSPQC
jgi:hypothetical protein